MEKLNSKHGKKMISGIPLHTYPKEYILQKMDENIKGERAPEHICITNTESMYYAEKYKDHKEFIGTAAFSLCDGIGSAIAANLQGNYMRRFNGPDFLLEASRYGQDKGWRHFFCGGKEGVADLLAENLKEKYPAMEIAGTFCPPFRELTETEENEMIAKIKDSKADVLWVGLGLLKQERWISKYKEQVDVPWSVGVGAAFDFYAGTVKRAPKFFRDLGLEWLFRLSRERRMIQRNINSYKFMSKSIADGILQKLK
ncbi:WecB/TagA/CpsF family glycosyltransferase [Luteirhabdus pelagi]|uniref:WecB/TagA/CpsF family glycosyltransferase n=1 Tax=Luteirhabdus pelagi TaxID=2792783 RepID=UPI001939B77A|nr:WecB/TagA/CpsF family glycosyltransferase [Luteirhabdus pelagi]